MAQWEDAFCGRHNPAPLGQKLFYLPFLFICICDWEWLIISLNLQKQQTDGFLLCFCSNTSTFGLLKGRAQSHLKGFLVKIVNKVLPEVEFQQANKEGEGTYVGGGGSYG